MVLIRADANPNIGMGHIMRCLSIADAFRTAGQDVTFILADDLPKQIIEDHGFKTIILHSSYKNLEAELLRWPACSPDYIIVDSYYVTGNYLVLLKKTIAKEGKIVYIDDIASFPYPVDILINYNAYGPWINYHELYDEVHLQEPQFILGPTFAPLRTMFRGIGKKEQKKDVKNILISTGGSDPEHLALKIVQAKPEKFTYYILLGNMNPDKKEIKAIAQECSNLVVLENVSDMKNLIFGMDIAVSAAGSTLYEICVCGVPLITYVLADNQIPGAAAFEKLGLAVNLGDIRNMSNPVESILSQIKVLAKDYSGRVETGQRMQQMIDGFGADRIISEIMKLN